MPSLGDMYRRGAEIPVRVKGLEFRVTYDPGRVTNRLMRELRRQDLDDDDEAFDGTVRALRQILTRWDVTDDAGEPAPLTEDALHDLPLEVLLAINRAILRDVTDPKAK